MAMCLSNTALIMAACIVCSLGSSGVCWIETGLIQGNNIVKYPRTAIELDRVLYKSHILLLCTAHLLLEQMNK